MQPISNALRLQLHTATKSTQVMGINVILRIYIYAFRNVDVVLLCPKSLMSLILTKFIYKDHHLQHQINFSKSIMKYSFRFKL